MLALNFQSTVSLWVADTEIAQDVFVKHNVHLDKSIESFLTFKCIIGSSFTFAPNDDTWKIKRKAMAHTFYKDRLQHMLETLKRVLLETFATWASKIDQNGFHDINMATEFSDIFTRNIILICYGEDLADDVI